jgi:putative Mg2+ transporter-C (MgtC) family protein
VRDCHSVTPAHDRQPPNRNAATFGLALQLLRGRQMSVVVTWQDALVRLLLTLGTSAIIGLNRSEHGRPAGLRTNMLVALTACVCMILTNDLMPSNGKPIDSYVVLDLMRLPLGLLSGMGFIGAGAIFRHGSLVRGVTTAAMLWFATMLGLCFGAGDNRLGVVAFVAAILIATVVRWAEKKIKEDRTAMLTVTVRDDQLTDEALQGLIEKHPGFRVHTWNVFYNEGHRRLLKCEVRFRTESDDTRPPSFVGALAEKPGVVTVQWQPA